MIRVSKNEIPDILVENQQAWTAKLLNLVKEYGGYNNIPEKLKNEAVNKYRHKDIKDAVIGVTKGKCVFCESYIEAVDYSNIEHFHPKSLYPKLTFKWSNLFPACRKCNIPKGDTDTKSITIVHPVNDDVDKYFSYPNLKIQPSENAPCQETAINTIKECDLDRISLCRQHGEILITVYELEEKIQEKIDHYNGLTQSGSKLKVVIKLKEAIDNLKEQSRYSKPYAGFLRYIIFNSSTINTALDIINTHTTEIGMNEEYEFEWNVYA